MKETEEPVPTLPKEELPERLTNAQLVKDFRAFAYNNEDFKNGSSDELTIKASRGDRLPPVEEYPPRDYGRATYQFEAVRHRFQDKETKDELFFTLSVIAVRSHIELPAHIAVDAYGIADRQEAVENGGLSDLEHRMRFVISSTRRMLAVCESFSYTDASGNMVSHTINPSGDNVFDVGYEDEDDELYDEFNEDDSEEEDDTEDDGPEVFFVDQQNQPGNQLTIHEELESLPDMTVDESTQMWQQLGEIERSMADVFAAQEDANLLQAFSSFELFKRGLRKQLGLD